MRDGVPDAGLCSPDTVPAPGKQSRLPFPAGPRLPGQETAFPSAWPMTTRGNLVSDAVLVGCTRPPARPVSFMHPLLPRISTSCSPGLRVLHTHQ